MPNQAQNSAYFVLPQKRDLLDIMESYRYMNSALMEELLKETTWDHGTGWVQLNISPWDWRTRLEKELPLSYPRASE
ncbi:MAG: hypothetical protein GW938_16890 [Leptospira sp.]|nr:hypothetical protein [Leptospira sp.]NCS95286.1 hypothetical protein [Leptospira sp.]